MTDTETHPEAYANTPMGERKAHLFRGEAVRSATLVEGVTDEPVQSICGLVKSYGDFTDDIPEDRCENCASKLETNDTDD